jgi:hypothetical protein
MWQIIQVPNRFNALKFWAAANAGMPGLAILLLWQLKKPCPHQLLKKALWKKR